MEDLGFNVNKKDKDGWTLLHWAANYGQVKIAEYLITKGADVNAKDYNEITPVFYAVESGSLKICKLLVQHGAKYGPNTLKKDKASLTQTEMYNLNQKNEIMGLTYPINIAILEDNLKIVKYFVDTLKFNTNQPDSLGLTSMHWAAYFDCKDIVTYLLNKSAKPDIPADNTFYTPLILAITWQNTDICKILLDHGANPNAVTKTGKTPIFFAVETGNIELCKLLIERGAKLNQQDNLDSETPLFYAIQQNNLEICKLLIEKGADVNIADKYGWTPLHKAAFDGKFEICKLLIEHGVDVNAKITSFYRGFTPLHFAAKNGYYKICKLLLEHGADPNAKGKIEGKLSLIGYTPLALAKKQKHRDIVQLLKQYGGKRF